MNSCLRSVIALRAAACVLLIVFLVGCGEDDGADSQSVSPAKKHLLDALTPPQPVVQNGGSAILKLKKGFAMVITHMNDINTGHYRVLYSTTGDFSNDSKQLEDWSGRMVDKMIQLPGCSITVSGATAESARIRLSVADEHTAVAVVGTNNPSDVDLSDLKFEANTPVDQDTWEQFLREEGVIK